MKDCECFQLGTLTGTLVWLLSQISAHSLWLDLAIQLGQASPSQFHQMEGLKYYMGLNFKVFNFVQETRDNQLSHGIRKKK
jgi:hypothetical protein